MASLDSLPPDQRAVLQLVLQRGRTYDDIAQLLSISPLTVKSHVKNAMDRLEADTRTEAVASALRQSLIT